MFEAADENDLEVVTVVLREGTHIDIDEEERSAHVGTCIPISWDERCKIGWLLRL